MTNCDIASSGRVPNSGALSAFGGLGIEEKISPPFPNIYLGFWFILFSPGMTRLTRTAAKAPTVMEDENIKLKSVGIVLTISWGNKETQTVIKTGIPMIKMFRSSSSS
jgi:hypothetical protein